MKSHSIKEEGRTFDARVLQHLSLLNTDSSEAFFNESSSFVPDKSPPHQIARTLHSTQIDQSVIRALGESLLFDSRELKMNAAIVLHRLVVNPFYDGDLRLLAAGHLLETQDPLGIDGLAHLAASKEANLRFRVVQMAGKYFTTQTSSILESFVLDPSDLVRSEVLRVAYEHRNIASSLLQRIAIDGDNDSSETAIGALVGIKHASVHQILVDKMEKNPHVPTWVLKSLGETGDRRAVPLLIDRMRTQKGELAERLIIAGALGKLGDIRALPVLKLKFVKEQNKKLLSHCNEAIEAITENYHSWNLIRYWIELRFIGERNARPPHAISFTHEDYRPKREIRTLLEIAGRNISAHISEYGHSLTNSLLKLDVFKPRSLFNEELDFLRKRFEEISLTFRIPAYQETSLFKHVICEDLTEAHFATSIEKERYVPPRAFSQMKIWRDGARKNYQEISSPLLIKAIAEAKQILKNYYEEIGCPPPFDCIKEYQGDIRMNADGAANMFLRQIHLRERISGYSYEELVSLIAHELGHANGFVRASIEPILGNRLLQG